MLFPYQVEGVKFLASHKQGFLFDDPGLGKSVQALTYLAQSPNPAIVICPAIAKGVWQAEIQKWGFDKFASIVCGRGNFRWPKDNEIVIINPDILPDDWSKFIWNVPLGLRVIVDECHQFKSFKTKRSKVLSALAKATIAVGGTIHGMTGTPILSSPADLYGLLTSFHLLHATYRNWTNFAYEFHGVNTPFGWRFPSTPRPTAMKKMEGLFIRRRKSEVLQDLPEKIFTEVKVDSGMTEEINIENQDFDVQYPTHLMSWRSENARRKGLAAVEYVRTLIDGGEQVVVFSAHRNGIAPFAELGGMITGDTSHTARTKMVEDFQNGNLKCISGTIGAMSVAVTLTAACHVIFIDRDWTPAMNKQAEDRVCRIGQTRGTIVVDITSDNNTDKLVTRVLKQKTQLIENTFGA